MVELAKMVIDKKLKEVHVIVVLVGGIIYINSTIEDRIGDVDNKLLYNMNFNIGIVNFF